MIPCRRRLGEHWSCLARPTVARLVVRTPVAKRHRDQELRGPSVPPDGASVVSDAVVCGAADTTPKKEPVVCGTAGTTAKQEPVDLSPAE